MMPSKSSKQQSNQQHPTTKPNNNSLGLVSKLELVRDLQEQGLNKCSSEVLGNVEAQSRDTLFGRLIAAKPTQAALASLDLTEGEWSNVGAVSKEEAHQVFEMWHCAKIKQDNY